MTRLPRRPARLVATGVLAALVLTGCGEGPVRAGAAATVGSDRIEIDQLADSVDRALADPEAAQQLGDRAGAQRQVLSRLITSELLAEAAQREGVTITQGDVAAKRQEFRDQLGGEEQLVAQAADAGLPESELPQFFRDQVVQERLGDVLTAGEQVDPQVLQALYQEGIAQYDQVLARHILLGSPAEAQRVLAQVRADPDSFAEIAEAQSLDEGSAANGGLLPATGRGGFVAPFENALFAAEEGELGVVQTEFGTHVFQLVERRTTTLAEATPQLRRQALAEERDTALRALFEDVSRDVPVRVNPRFGRWDPAQVAVVDAESRVSTPAPDAGTGGEVPFGEAPLEAPGEAPVEAPGEAPVEQPQG